MNILRFITAGSVDDGKSTLIGRLLYDSKSILADQLEVLEQQSKNKNEDGVDLAILTDGLRAEREQGITIDVAYRYFSTPKKMGAQTAEANTNAGLAAARQIVGFIKEGNERFRLNK